MALVEAIQQSCNVYFYNVGQTLTADRMVDWYRKFGLADRAGTGLPAERSAVLPSSEWLRRHPGPGAARHMAIGQGPVVVTPLHVANFMATIARKGKFLSPLLVYDGPVARVRRDLKLKADHLKAVTEGLDKVVNDPDGTAHEYFHDAGFGSLGVRVCGKTGTATAPPQRWHGMIVRRGDMAWFVGFAPRENPEIAFAVVVEYVTSGGSANACPIARRVVQIWHGRKTVRPSVRGGSPGP